MNYDKQKAILKKLRKDLNTPEHELYELHIEFASELVDLINTLIGRINCYATDDDTEMERMAIEDELVGAK